MRLNRFLSQAGIASRRGADKIILSGQLKLNGKIVRELGIDIDPLKDELYYNNKRIFLTHKNFYYLIYKPRKIIVTKKDPEKRKTVYELIPHLHPSVNAVGRLDYESEGLLLLTNDGDLAYSLTHPSFEIKKVYHVLLNRLPNQEQILKLESGIILEQSKTSPSKIKILSLEKKLISIEIHEGKKRQVRKMFEWANCKVKKLTRVEFGQLKLGSLKSGEWRMLSDSEIFKLKNK